MEIQTVNDLMDDFKDNERKNNFLEVTLQGAIDNEDIFAIRKYYYMLAECKNLVSCINKMVSDYSCKN